MKVMMTTMLTSQTLLSKWNGLPKYGGGFARIDSLHPLEFHIGYEAMGQKTLLFISAYEPKAIKSSRSISVSVGKRHDCQWAVSFSLIRKEQESVFTHLCCDLIESSRLQNNDLMGLQFVLNRYTQWHRLMEHQANGLLNESARKGLLGEVLFLLQMCIGGMTALDAVSGWIGAEGADRDFVYGDEWHEVKTVGIASKAIGISSLEQLDAPPLGEVVVYFIDKSAPGDSSSFTLKSKIDEARDICKVNEEAYDLFNTKLLHYGYMDLREYEEEYYRFGDMRKYKINETFPRLTRACVPVQITEVTYEISLNAIEHWLKKQ